MNLPPKEYVVYWAGKFDGKDPGYSEPMYTSNVRSFGSAAPAQALYEKLNAIMAEGGVYQGRIVCHVASCF